MKLLLDTHTLLWYLLGDSHLSPYAKSLIDDIDNEIYVSVVSIWEIATKVRIGKMMKPGHLLDDPFRTLQGMGFLDLQLTLKHARLGGSFVHPHKDPFDRMLAAQAMVENLPLVSADSVFDAMPVQRLW
jgi:PIN domain nuclease of toxin-antitoxin system